MLRFRLPLLLAPALLLAAVPARPAAAQCTTSWTNPAGGDWATAANWDNGLPDASDDACITLGGTYTVTRSAPTTVHSLTVGGASGTQTLVLSNDLTIGAASTITAGGVLEWQNGYLRGAALTNQGTVRLTGTPGARGALGAVFRNEGTLRWDDGIFYVHSQGTLRNAGLIDVYPTDDGLVNFGAGPNTFVNEAAGTLRLSAPSGTFYVGGGVTLDNYGRIEATTAATLRLDGNATHRGGSVLTTTAAGATVFLNGGVHTFEGTVSGSPTGATGGVAVGNAAALAGGAGATLDFSGTGFQWQNGYLTSGTLTNAGLVVLNTNPGARGALGAVFRNEGTLRWDDGIFYVHSQGTLRNAGLIDVYPTDDGLVNFGAGPNTFVNEAAGTLRLSAPSGTFYVGGGVTLDNYGRIEATTAATLRLDGNATHRGGSVLTTTAAGATVFLNGGVHTFEGAVTGSPVGTVAVGGNAALAGGTDATLDFGGTGFQWQHGYLTAGTLTNAGLVVLNTNTGGRGVQNPAAIFRNEGTVRWDDGIFYLYNQGRWENAALVDVRTPDDQMLPFSTGPHAFVNEPTGSFVRTTGTGYLAVGGGVDFRNEGVVEVQVGTLYLRGDHTHADGSTLTAASGALLHLDQGTHLFEGTVSGSPAGTVALGGSATMQAGAGAALDFAGTGFQWQSNYLTAGTLTNAGLLVLNTATGSRGVQNPGTVLRNEGTVRWDDGIFYLNNQGRWENAGLVDYRSTDDQMLPFSTGPHVFSNEATGTFRKSTNGGFIVLGTGVDFENAGTVEALTGTIYLRGDLTYQDGSVLTAAVDAAVLLDQGTHLFEGTVSGSPAGTVAFGGSATMAGGTDATLDFSGTGLQWQGNYLTAGTLTNAGLVVLNTATGSRGVQNPGTVLRNEGTVRWDDGIFYLNNQGRWENAGLIDYRSNDDQLLTFSTGPYVFVNEATGTLAKTAGGGSLHISPSVTFTNAGTISAEDGTINVQAATMHTGVAQGTATLQYGAGFTNAGTFAPGTSPGILTVSGGYNNRVLEVELGGTTAGTGYDRLAVTGAAVTDDTLRVRVLDSLYAPTVGDAFTVLTAASRTGEFAAVEGPPGFVFDVAYTPTSVVLTVDSVGVATVLTAPPGAATPEEGEGWRMLAPAVTGATFDDLLAERWTQGFPGADYDGPLALPNVYTYDETVTGPRENGYVPPSSQAAPLALGTGLFAYVYADDDYAGPGAPAFPKTILQSGVDHVGPFAFPAVSYTDSGDPTADGWNLLGNPYAATMDWDAAGWTKTNVDNVIYVWDPAVAQYLTWNGEAGSLGSGRVAPAQGFWVHATAAAPALAAPAAARTTGGDFVGRPAALGPDDALVELRVAPEGGGPLVASAHVLFTPAGAAGRDRLDAYELAPLAPTALALFSTDAEGTALDIQTLPPAGAATEVAFGAAAWRGGAPDAAPLVLTWPVLAGVGGVRLLDLATGTEVDLRRASSYRFTLTPQESAARAASVGGTVAPAALAGGAGRFRLVVNAATPTAGEPPAPAPGAPEAPAETALFAPAPNPFTGVAAVRYALAEAGHVRILVHDLLGREVARLVDGEVAVGTYAARLSAGDLAAGVYVVRMEGPGGFLATRRVTVLR